MASTSKYRRYGVRRENNLSDIKNPEISLNNLLDNLPVVVDGKTFISQDLDVIRGLGGTNVSPSTFTQIGGTAPTYTYFENDEIKEDYITPIIRLKDRFTQYREVTGDVGQFGSGLGPRAFFIPSDKISNFTKTTSFDDAANTSGVETSDDFWVLGEFQINNRIRPNFPDSYGGIMWEGYFLPNPITSYQNFSFLTTGLFHAEYDRFGDGNWLTVASIYAEERTVEVAATVSNSTTVSIIEDDVKYVAKNDVVNGDDSIFIDNIVGNVLTLSNPISVNAGENLTLTFVAGIDDVNASFEIPIISDRAETPAFKVRFFWWFPTTISNDPEFKYLNVAYSSSTILPFSRFSIEEPTNVYGDYEIRKLIEDATTPIQEEFGETGSSGTDYKDFQNENYFQSVYTPISSLAQITNVSGLSIEYVLDNKYIIGNSSSLSQTEFGNYIVPTDPTQMGIGGIIPKNLRLKDTIGATSISTTRIVNQSMPSTETSVSVEVINHNGLIDYYVATSASDVVTISEGDTSNLRVDMICITSSTLSTDFVRITEIISSTQFRTSVNLGITDAYVFVYANAGVIDRSKEIFCDGVFGQVLTANATSDTLTLGSVDGIVSGQVVQFEGYIPSATTVLSIVGNDVTISNSVTQTIQSGSTIIFAPSGTSANKESCVLPIDLSPPFLGIDTGLSTDGNNIKSTSPTEFNVVFANIISEANTTVSSAGSSPAYDTTIVLANGYKILADSV